MHFAHQRVFWECLKGIHDEQYPNGIPLASSTNKAFADARRSLKMEVLALPAYGKILSGQLSSEEKAALRQDIYHRWSDDANLLCM